MPPLFFFFVFVFFAIVLQVLDSNKTGAGFMRSGSRLNVIN